MTQNITFSFNGFSLKMRENLKLEILFFYMQDHSEIVKSTLGYVSKCPISREHTQIINCADVCGRNCTYHCMRDSSKTKLVEFCAIPEILFGKIKSSFILIYTLSRDFLDLHFA